MYAFSYNAIKIKIIIIIIKTYLLLYIWSKMWSSSQTVLLELSETTSPQKTIPILLHHTVFKMYYQFNFKDVHICADPLTFVKLIKYV